jgi:hypothetical protein
VSEGEVVQALAPAVGALSEDVGEELDAELLLVALVGFDQAPGIVEFGLQGGVWVFFLVLGAQDLEFGGFEGGFCVGGVWEAEDVRHARLDMCWGMGLDCIQGSLSEVMLKLCFGCVMVTCFVACNISISSSSAKQQGPTSSLRQDPRAALPSRGEVAVFIRDKHWRSINQSIDCRKNCIHPQKHRPPWSSSTKTP